MRGSSLTGIVGAALALLLLGRPSTSMAQELTFFPTIMTTQGDLELSMNGQTTEFSQGGTRTRATNTYFREKISVAADGYVYHPRFQLFLVKLAGALDQGTFGQASSSPSGNSSHQTSRLAPEYELRTIFLPEHPYNLELFAVHREPTGPGMFWQGQTAKTDEEGAMFRYRSKPWFFHTSYTRLTLESPANRTDTTNYQVNGSYAGTIISHSASYLHNDSTSSHELHIVRDKAGYGNILRYAGITLDSRVDGTSTDQQQTFGPDYRTRLFIWTERMTAPLPGNASTMIDYRYMSENDRTAADPVSQEDSEVFNRSSNATFTLQHQLYQSLMSYITLNDTNLTSTTGEVLNRSGSYNGTYTKLIPAGRLTAGLQAGIMESENRGMPVVINELHNAPLLGSFTLNQENIASRSIEVRVKDPPTGSLLLMPTGNYVVALGGSKTQITILSIAPATPQPDPAYVYEFQVNYNLPNQSTIVTDFRGFSVRTDLWDSHLSPYYSYFDSDPRVTSGSIPGGPDRYTSEILGVATKAGSYAGMVERQHYRSRLNPSESWKARAEYRSPVTADTNLSFVLSYLQTHHLASTASQGTSDYRDRSLGADVLMDMNFRPQYVHLFLSGSFYRNRGAVDSNSIMFNSYVTWQIGMLSISGGVQASRLYTMLPTGDSVYESVYYYVIVDRKLF